MPEDTDDKSPIEVLNSFILTKFLRGSLDGEGYMSYPAVLSEEGIQVPELKPDEFMLLFHSLETAITEQPEKIEIEINGKGYSYFRQKQESRKLIHKGEEFTLVESVYELGQLS